MKDNGQPSSTAIYMALARAFADHEKQVARFSDPIAFRLLPSSYVVLLERMEENPKAIQSRILKASLRGMESVPLRTVAIDEAIRHGPRHPQFAILGAGLDTRAWRLPELDSCVVFEVDHPLTQRYKQDHIAGFPLVAREIRFVPVDFERDSLGRKLDEAGHELTVPTTWLWEGVITYLRQKSIEETLRIVAERSARQSRLLVHYSTPYWLRQTFGIVAALSGEPFRSAFRPEQMRELLGRFGFAVLSDENAADWMRKYTEDTRKASSFLASERLAIAER